MSMVRTVHGTNSQWYKKSRHRVHYTAILILISIITISLIDRPTWCRQLTQ